MLDAKAIADATAEIVRSHVAQATAPLIKRIEQLEAFRPEKGDRGEPGPRGEPGRDGVSIGDGFIQRDGVLVLTLSDGSTRELGPIVGKDGADGRDGAPGEKGADGVDGKDGRDGFDLEAFDCEAIDERTIELRFTGAGQVHRYELEFPVPIHRGIFKAGETYKRGDWVTWGGECWVAQCETQAKPDCDDWLKAVRKGRDGKDAK